MPCKPIPVAVILLIQALLLLGAATSGWSAQTLTWTGAASSLWSDSANWSPVAVPGNNDDLVFPSTATFHLSNSNDIPGLSLHSISIHRTTAGGYTIDGSVNTALQFLNLDNDYLTTSSHSITVTMPITLTGTGMTVTSTVNTFAVLDSPITGTSTVPLIFSGTGETYLGAANGYNGPTTIQSGRVTAGVPLALGTTVNGTTVLAGATLGFVGTFAGASFAEPLSLAGPAASPSATLIAFGSGTVTVTLTGPISLAGNVQVAVRNNDHTLNLACPISGSGGLTRIVYGFQAGLLILSGASGVHNTYTGTTTIMTGELRLNHDGSNDAIVGPLVIGDGTHAATVKCLQSHEIGDDVPVTINASSLFDLSVFSDIIASLNGVGTLQSIGGSNTLHLMTTADATYSGVIFGDMRLVVESATGAAQTLAGSNTIFGGILVPSGGTLIAASNVPHVDIEAGGRLFLTHGIVFGTLVATGGTVTSTGSQSGTNLSILSGATLAAVIDGASVGSYTNITLAGTVDITGGLLSVGTSTGYNAPVGTALVIIVRSGTSLAAGSFTGMPEGTLIAAGPNYYRITYVGGDGNDIALVRDATSPPVTPTPVSPKGSGGGCGLGMAPAGAALILAFGMIRFRRRLG